MDQLSGTTDSGMCNIFLYMNFLYDIRSFQYAPVLVLDYNLIFFRFGSKIEELNGVKESDIFFLPQILEKLQVLEHILPIVS